ncbi:hypothetical protein FS842_011409, partial [Serendipita sp. 407]
EVVDDDLWTLQYISLPRVPAILEAFDDDGSGFINVVEVNEFTSSRPQDWSLVHWLAYWAEGWHYTIWEYRNKICSILKGMYGLVDRMEIHSANRSIVDLYLSSSTFKELDQLIKSVTPYTEANTAVLEEKIRGYIDKEEERLKSNLQKVDWNIDGLDTLSLITGRGRIERYIFPLLYLVLRRHFWMLRLACQDTFAEDVLRIPAQSISTIMSTVLTRIRNLSAVLKQRSADPSALIGNVAFGMFKLLNDSKLAVDEFDEDAYLPEFGSGDIPEEELGSITQAGSLFGPLADNSGYGEAESLDQDELLEGDGILHGVWTGYTYYSDDGRSDGLMQFNIIHTEGSKLRGTGIDRLDVYHMEGEVTLTAENGLDLILKVAYGLQPSKSDETFAFEFTGSLNTSTLELKGTWAVVGYPPAGPFVLIRRPTFAYPFLYSKSELSENRARARWKFAITTIRQQVRRQWWSWSYFKDRMEQRKRYVELRLRMDIEQLYSVNGAARLSSDEILELNSTGERLHPADGRYYISLAKKAMRMLCIHRGLFGLYCDGCYSGIIGQRLICLDCMTADLSNNVDMCEFCMDHTASNESLSFEHHPSHNSLLIFRTLYNRKRKVTITNARALITAGKETLGSSDNKIECVSCSCPIEMPCWLCIEWECGNDTFICAACQKKKDAAYKRYSHTSTHSLVRLSHTVASSKQTVEETLGSLNSRLTEDLADVRSRVEKLEARVDQRITAVEQRLSKMEELLLQVFTSVSSLQSSS